MIAILFFTQGCESTRGGNQSGPRSTVSERTATSAAVSVASRGSGRVTGKGVGDSMAPLYAGDTMVVTNPIDFKDLESGMVVAYRNRNGQNVVHTLSHREGYYWVAMGLNNYGHDAERVTPQNLIGVVYATFHTGGQKP